MPDPTKPIQIRNTRRLATYTPPAPPKTTVRREITAAAVAQYACPQCGAATGRRCHGLSRGLVHYSRTTAALAGLFGVRGPTPGSQMTVLPTTGNPHAQP
jgi:predicted RNA-binding Zn-ribbon protein involved in translation (DUF1610 family)